MERCASSSTSRKPSKVGAVCGNAARTVLCGGRSAMIVPTATSSQEAYTTGNSQYVDSEQYLTNAIVKLRNDSKGNKNMARRDSDLSGFRASSHLLLG